MIDAVLKEEASKILYLCEKFREIEVKLATQEGYQL